MKKFDKLLKISKKLIDLPDPRSNKHFTFIVIRNKIISIGYNLSFTTHPLANKYGYRFDTQHSELKAILNYPFSPSYLSKCTLINIRIMSNGEIGISKPCPRCQRLLKDFGISRIYFTNRNGKFERL